MRRDGGTIGQGIVGSHLALEVSGVRERKMVVCRMGSGKRGEKWGGGFGLPRTNNSKGLNV